MAQLEVNTDLLFAAYTCVSDEATRYYLNGVFFTPAPDPKTGRGVLMVATDGHRMALVWDESGVVDKPRIVRLDSKSKALKPGRGEYRRVLHVDGLERGKDAFGRVALDYTDGEGDPPFVDVLTVHEINGDFPDWSRVMPKSEEGHGVKPGQFFNTDYLASFTAAFRRIRGDKSASMSVSQPEAGAPAWFWDPTLPHVRFICMPMRSAAGEAGRPFWIDLATAARHAQEQAAA
jgi:hypothetical protein